MISLKTVLGTTLIAASMTAATARATLYHVVLMGGQSNMDGHDPADTSQLPAALQAPQTNVLFNDSNNLPGASTAGYYTGNTFAPLQPGAITSAPGGVHFGPEVTFGQKIAADNPANNYALIKYAVTGSNLYGQWKAPTAASPTTGNLYANFKTAVSSALKLITDAGNTYEIDGMLWLQGEQDAGDPTNAANYQTNLLNFIADVRKTYGADLPFVIGGIGYSGTTADRTLVQNAFSYAAANLPDVRYFNNDDINTAKGLHFTTSMQETIGQRFASSLESIPEPTSLATFGLAGFIALRRRRR